MRLISKKKDIALCDVFFYEFNRFFQCNCSMNDSIQASDFFVEKSWFDVHTFSGSKFFFKFFDEMKGGFS